MSHETDCQAWGMENLAYSLPKGAAEVTRGAAKEFRFSVLHAQVVEIFKRGDEQNKIIDIGLKVGKVPILT